MNGTIVVKQHRIACPQDAAAVVDLFCDRLERADMPILQVWTSEDGGLEIHLVDVSPMSNEVTAEDEIAGWRLIAEHVMNAIADRIVALKLSDILCNTAPPTDGKMH